MVGGPLTGGSFNPARWFGPALVDSSFTSEWWLFILGPIVGSLVAAAVYRFVLEAGGLPPTEPPEPVRSTPKKPESAKPDSTKPKTEPAT